MLAYIVEFEQLNKKCTNSKIDTDALLALKLLFNANLTEHQKQLALTACPQMNYEIMKNVLTRIFTTAKTKLQINNKVEIKEVTMITENCGKGRKPFRGFMYRGHSRTIGRSLKRMNPVFKGFISRCNVCESPYPGAKDYPHANKNRPSLALNTVFSSSDTNWTFLYSY